MIEHKITIDLVRRGVKPVIDAVQGDTGSRVVVITLLSNGVPFEIPAESLFLLKYKRQDGSGGTYDTLPDGNKVYSTIGNTVSVVLVSPILSKSGLIDVQIQMDINNTVLSTFAFLINAEKEVSGSGTVTEEDYTNIQTLVQQEVKNALEDAQESGKFHGPEGATFIPAVSPEGVISWSNDRGLPNPEPVDIKGPKGEKGDTGSQGIPGEKGDKGDTGATGSKGADGKTPVKGVDYFTEVDKAEIVAEVAEMLDGSPEIIITTNEHGYWYNNNGVPEFYVPADNDACSKETNYIEASEGDVFRVKTRCSNGHAANGAWYDVNKNVISIIIVEDSDQSFKTVELTAPSGTAYARFFSVTFWEYTSDDNIILEVEYLGKEEDTAPASPLKGKKIVYDGDSICSSWGISTNGGSYPQIIADIVGGTFDNQGVGGGRIVTQEGSSDTFHSIVDNLVNLPTDGDLYCFEGGVNDHWNDVPLGTYSESDYTGALDKTTYCGALETIFRYATTKFVGKPICYIIVHKCPYSAFSKYGTEHTFADFREAALGICEKYSIPVYDAWKDSGINSWNAAQLANFFIVDEETGTGDGVHPNEAGYRRYYVPQLIDLFERIMPIGVEDVESPGEPDIPVEPDVPDEPELTYTNLIPTAVDADGSTIYNGKGYKENTRMSGSSGGFRDNTGSCCTGYMKIPESGTITVRLKNITANTADNYGFAVLFFIGTGVACADNVSYGTNLDTYYSPVYDDDGNVIQFTTTNTKGWTHMVISAVTIDETSIITINEPIE